VLVAAAMAAGYRCVPIPGASSALAALSVAGDAHGTGFEFVGFLPARGHERMRALDRLAATPRTCVVFEAPHRIDALAEGLAARCADRAVTLCRELTKQFETVHTTPAGRLPAWLAADPNRLRGEFVVVLHALRTTAGAAEEGAAHDATLRPLLAALPLRQAVALAAELTGAPRNALYARALALKGSAS
jgi:16S rRNA (cytidine1402-2'-O)-methyltransferase